jgi:hypothetical protein
VAALEYFESSLLQRQETNLVHYFELVPDLKARDHIFGRHQQVSIRPV